MLPVLRRSLPLLAIAALTSGCGTTSSTSVNAPSARCAVTATAQPAVTRWRTRRTAEPTLIEASKIDPTGMLPASRCRPMAWSPIDATQPHSAQFGFPPN